MSSKLLININDANPVVVPDTDAPDTGMFSVSHTDGVSFNASMVLPIIGITVLSIAILAGIIVAISRRKKVNRFTTHTNKHLVAKLTTLSVVVLLGVLGVMNLDKLSNLASAVLLVDDLKNADENTLTITASDIKIDVDLNDKAVFATGESTVTVSSATEAGYTLMAYVDSTTTDLTNETNKSSKSKITMLSSNEPAALTDNTWGIATAKPTSQTAEVFTGLPTTLDEAITLKTTEEATTANDKSTFYYGTYITPDLDYGTYSGATITYIAIANYVGPCNPNATTIQEAVCMQDFAGPNRDQIVDSMTPETQYTLMDMRDEKSYTIAKLYARKISGAGRDAVPKSTFQVWMTQNLDLDLDSNTTYTNEDTDLGYNSRTGQYESASWKPSLSTYTTGTTTWRGLDTTPESYDPGDIYWNEDMSSGADWDEYRYSCSWSSNEMPYDCDESINPGSYYISPTGIPQYHLGNYYNWTATIAVNDSSNRYYRLIDQSICPAGWALPRPEVGDDTFYSLWDFYAFFNHENRDDRVWLSPLYFVASGKWLGALYEVGAAGSFWSAWANPRSSTSGPRAESADFWLSGGSGFTSTIGTNNINEGASVRCIARPVTIEIKDVPII